jgi:hypothetical protein
MELKNQRLKQFYSQVTLSLCNWFSDTACLQLWFADSSSIDSMVAAKGGVFECSVTPSREDLERFCRAINYPAKLVNGKLQAPLDYAIVASCNTHSLDMYYAEAVLCRGSSDQESLH